MTWHWQRLDLKSDGVEEHRPMTVSDDMAANDLQKLRKGRFSWRMLADTETYSIFINEGGFGVPSIVFYWNDGKET